MNTDSDSKLKIFYVYNLDNSRQIDILPRQFTRTLTFTDTDSLLTTLLNQRMLTRSNHGSVYCYLYSDSLPSSYVGHMSAEQKLCFSNWPKGETNIFQLRIPHWFRGYVSPNQIHLLFGTFGQKMGQKGHNMGLRCLDFVWHGLAWSSCDIGSWQHPRIFSIGPK